MMQRSVKLLLLLWMFLFAAFDVFFLFCFSVLDFHLPDSGVLISINISVMCSVRIK